MNKITVPCEESLKGTHTPFPIVKIGYNSPLHHQLTQAKILPAHKEKKDFFVQNFAATRKECQTSKITYHCTQMLYNSFRWPRGGNCNSQKTYFFQFSWHFVLTFVKRWDHQKEGQQIQTWTATNEQKKKLNCRFENINFYNDSSISN